jgi:hypothetical protein
MPSVATPNAYGTARFQESASSQGGESPSADAERDDLLKAVCPGEIFDSSYRLQKSMRVMQPARISKDDGVKHIIS